MNESLARATFSLLFGSTSDAGDAVEDASRDGHGRTKLGRTSDSSPTTPVEKFATPSLHTRGD